MNLDDDRQTPDEEPPPPPASSPPVGGSSFGGGRIVLFVVFLVFLVAWKARGFRIVVIGVGAVLLFAWGVLTPSKRTGYDGQLQDDRENLQRSNFTNNVIFGIIRWIWTGLFGGGEGK